MTEGRRRHRLIRRLLVFGPAIVVVIVGILSYASQRREANMSRLVQHTRDVIGTSSDLLNALLSAESAVRGYVITGDTAMITPFRATPAKADSLLTHLRELTIDNPAQQKRLDELTALAHLRLARFDTVAAQAKPGTPLAAVAGISGGALGPGPQMMSEIHRLITSVQNDETRLLVDRRRRESEAAILSTLALAVGTIAAAILAFLVNRNMDRALADRRHALDESETTNKLLQEQTTELEIQAEVAQNAARDAEEATEQATTARVSAQESERRAERLQAATEALSSSLSSGDVAGMIVDQALAALRADSGIVATLEPNGQELRFIASRNAPLAELGTTISVNLDLPLCVVARTGKAFTAPTREDVRMRFPDIMPSHEFAGVRAIAAFPLRVDERMIGALLVRWNRDRTIAPGDAAFMAAMSRIAAEALDRARLFEAERDARAAAEAANRAKAAFLASMSHELRTPLQAALGFAQLVRSGLYGPVNDRQSEALSRVERSQMHLTRLIDDVLDFARLEAGRVRVDLEPVLLADVIADLTPLVEPQAANKNIELALMPPPDSLRVLADRQRLQQVLVNLVGNAIKFTPNGGSVRVGALHADERVTIQVRDTGPGIPSDRLQAIFEPFVQVEAGLTRTQPGAGLGLAISRDLARAMKGELSVESEFGNGSTFSLELPVAAD